MGQKGKNQKDAGLKGQQGEAPRTEPRVNSAQSGEKGLNSLKSSIWGLSSTPKEGPMDLGVTESIQWGEVEIWRVLLA